MVRFIHLGEDDDRQRGPVAIARRALEEAKKLSDSETVEVVGDVAQVRIEKNQFGGFQLRLHIHQSAVENEFCFDARAARREPIGNTTAKHTDVQELGADIRVVANIVKDAMDANPWELSTLDAASIGGTGALTDYEFKFETGTLKGSITDIDIEDAIKNNT